METDRTLQLHASAMSHGSKSLPTAAAHESARKEQQADHKRVATTNPPETSVQAQQNAEPAGHTGAFPYNP